MVCLFSFLLKGSIKVLTILSISSVAQSCPTLCDPMNCSMPGLPVHHQFPEPTQTHVHWVSDAIQPSHPLSLGKGIRMMKQGLRVTERWLFYITKPFSISRIPSKGYYKLEFLTYIQTHKMQENKHDYNKLKITLKLRYGIFPIQK